MYRWAFDVAVLSVEYPGYGIFTYQITNGVENFNHKLYPSPKSII